MSQAYEMVKQRNRDREMVLKKVKQIIIERLNLDLTSEEIDDDSPLIGMGLGLDSIDSLELVVGVEDEFEVQIMDDNIEAFLSVNALVDFIVLDGKPATIEPYCPSPEINAQPWYGQYKKLREEAFFYETQCKLIELPDGDDTLALIARIVAGRDILLEPNKILHTAVLDDQGRLMDFIYILMFEDKFWLTLGPNSKEAEAFLVAEARNADIDLKIIDEQYCFFTIEGPYSWKIVKAIAGFEITGLTYLSFMEAAVGGDTLVLCRAGVTSEYGFRMILPRQQRQHLIEEIEKFDAFEVQLVQDRELINKVLACASAEVRFPLLDISVPRFSNPIEHELRWMIDFRKENYSGRSAINAIVQDFSVKIVGFVVTGELSESACKELQKDGQIYLDDQSIGKVFSLRKSIGINQYIGYGVFQKEWAYAGNSEYRLGRGSGEISIKTVSNPMLLSKSMSIMME